MSRSSERGVALVAFDGSPSSMAALAWGAENAPLLNLVIEVINVGNMPNPHSM